MQTSTVILKENVKIYISSKDSHYEAITRIVGVISFASRSPHHYDPPSEIIVNSNMYTYPHHGKRDYYEQFPRTHYQMQEPCATATVEGK